MGLYFTYIGSVEHIAKTNAMLFNGAVLYNMDCLDSSVQLFVRSVRGKVECVMQYTQSQMELLRNLYKRSSRF